MKALRGGWLLKFCLKGNELFISLKNCSNIIALILVVWYKTISCFERLVFRVFGTTDISYSMLDFNVASVKIVLCRCEVTTYVQAW